MRKRFSIHIHPAGGIAFALAFLFAPSIDVLSAAMALVLHELGHLLVLRACGSKDCHVELTPFGGMIDTRMFDRLSSLKQMSCALAGPVTSMLAFVCFMNAQQTDFVFAFEKANLSLCLINLLPVWPLDGARALTACASLFGKETFVRRLLSGFAWLIGIALSLLGLYGAWYGLINPTLLLAGPYLCYAARIGSVSSKIRNIDQIRYQLRNGQMLPVKMYACTANAKHSNLPIFFSRSSASSVQALMTVDPSTDKITSFQLERELLEEVVAGDGIDKTNEM